MDWLELILHYFSCRSTCLCDTKIKEEEPKEERTLYI